MIWLLLCLAQSEYRGTLAPELTIPTRLHRISEFKLATPDARRELGNIEGKVFAGKIRDARAFVVEGATTVLYVDTGRLTRYELRETYDPAQAGAAEVHFPLPGPAYKTYPVAVYVYREQGKPDSRMVGESPRAFVSGTVKIEGRDVEMGFEFDQTANTARPDNGWQRVDGAQEFLKDERPVYRIGKTFFAVDSIDLAAHIFTLKSRTAAEYTRIELMPGGIFPDFAFTDLEGRAHKLSDYAGRRVLLDFWATWCDPCMGALPKLRELHAHGLEILGMNVDENPEKPLALHLPWTNAALPSIRDIIEHRARIQMYPTYVLLDGGRKILASGDDVLSQP
jgi:thiol-disulfide isomerase/thioredoxin